MKRFLPSVRLLVGFALILPAAILAAPAGAVAASAVVLVGAGGLLVLLVVDGLRGPKPDALELERRLPRRLEVGEAARVHLVLRNRGSETWVVRLTDGCPDSLDATEAVVEATLPPGSDTEASYPVTPTARGRFVFEPAHLRLRRPNGLAEHVRELGPRQEARVLPTLRVLARHRLRARRDLMNLGGARRTRVLGRDGDFDRLRDFVPGDDIRHVDWKATARAGRPISRAWRAEKGQNLVVLIDGTRLMATQSAGTTKLDQALQAGLTLAWAGLAAGDRVAAGVFDDGMRTWVPPVAGLPRFGRILDSIYDAEAVQRFPRYQEAARHLLRLLHRRSLVVWITDLLDADQGQELVAAMRVLRRRHLSLVVALDDPEIRALAAAEPQDRTGLFVRVGATEMLDERQLLLRRLQGEGTHVLDVAADAVAPELVDRYLDIKMRGLV